MIIVYYELSSAQEEQVTTINGGDVCLPQQDFKHLWQLMLDVFLHSCNWHCFLSREI